MSRATVRFRQEPLPESELEAAVTPAPQEPARFPWDWLAWGLLVLGAAVLRFALLDRVPLDGDEASLSFAAWQASRGELDGSLAAQGAPVIGQLMAALFWLFGSGEITARLIPMLFGIALVPTPALVTRLIGLRAALLAGLLVAISPIAVQLSRVVDPAPVVATASALIVFSLIRIIDDRPSWAPWTLAGGIGVGLISAAPMIVALGMALLAAFAAWSFSWRQALSLVRDIFGRGTIGPATLGVGIAVGIGTAGLSDLRGIGYILGDLWGGLLTAAAPAPFPTRNLAALLAYALPLLALAFAGFTVGLRVGDRLAQFLGQWLILLITVAVALGQSVVSFALLPVLPAAVLAGMLIQYLRLTELGLRVSGSAWAAIVISGGLLVLLIVAVANLVSTVSSMSPFAYAIPVAVSVLALLLWRQQELRSERAAALFILGSVIFVAYSLSGIGRLSYGGSKPGTEVLPRIQTEQELRASLQDLTVKAMADPRITLVYDSETPIEVRWYGRWIRQVPVMDAPSIGGVQFVPLAANAPTGQPVRTPWRIVSELDRTDLHPLGVARWIISRNGLIEGRSRDVRISTTGATPAN